MQWTFRFWSSPCRCWRGPSSSPYWCAAAAAASVKKSGEFLSPLQKKAKNNIHYNAKAEEKDASSSSSSSRRRRHNGFLSEHWARLIRASPAARQQTLCGCSLDVRQHAAVCDSCPLELVMARWGVECVLTRAGVVAHSGIHRNTSCSFLFFTSKCPMMKPVKFAILIKK